MGHLTRDPELKRTNSDMSVAQIGIAINRKYKNKDGELKEEVTFVNCEAWGKTAEAMTKYLSKGKPVMIEGRLKLDQWQDDNGNNRSKLKVVVENFQFLDSKDGVSDSGGGYQSSQRKTASASAAPPADDIPF